MNDDFSFVEFVNEASLTAQDVKPEKSDSYFLLSRLIELKKSIELLDISICKLSIKVTRIEEDIEEFKKSFEETKHRIANWRRRIRKP